MIMESINSMPAKVVHVFDLRYDDFKVGRSVETDMKIADISVSRTHSFFKLQDGKLFVEDNGSKFGTLVKIQRPLPVLNSKTDGSSKSTLIQVGRTLLFLNMITQKDLKINFNSNRTRLLVNVDGSDSYLRLRKDNLAIPKEFYSATNEFEEDSLEFESQFRS
jgi:pSer/pThr/pTyr-binding forkhead associated (FHA) protein